MCIRDSYKIASTKELPAFPEPFDHLAEDFVRMCLRRDPGERPSAAELLTHPFVAEAGGAAGDVPALRYEYEGYWSGEDDAEGNHVSGSQEPDPGRAPDARLGKTREAGGGGDETEKKDARARAEGEEASPKDATPPSEPEPAVEDLSLIHISEPTRPY